MSFLSSPYLWGAGLVAVAGLGFLVYRQRTSGNSGASPLAAGGRAEVLLLRPGFRYVEATVTEKEKSLENGKVNGAPRHFYKYGRGWVGAKSTKFIAVDGSAYTKRIIEGVEQTLKVPEFLSILWGKAVYDKMPATLRKPLEEDTIGITLAPTSIMEDDDTLPRISSEDVNSEDEKTIKAGLEGAVKEQGKVDFMQMFIYAMVGGFVTYILCNIHILPVIAK